MIFNSKIVINVTITDTLFLTLPSREMGSRWNFIESKAKRVLLRAND